MGRWTQYDEDDYRLPEGMKRVGYDADTGRYTFIDKASVYYEGQPGEEYGYMTPITTFAPLHYDTPSRPRISVDVSPPPKTFAEILSAIPASPSIPSKSPFSGQRASTLPAFLPSYYSGKFTAAVNKVRAPQLANVVRTMMARKNSGSSSPHGDQTEENPPPYALAMEFARAESSLVEEPDIFAATHDALEDQTPKNVPSSSDGATKGAESASEKPTT